MRNSHSLQRVIQAFALALLIAPTISAAPSSTTDDDRDRYPRFLEDGRANLEPRLWRAPDARPDQPPARAAAQPDPLKDIAELMSEVVVDLTEYQTGQPVQSKQTRIVEQLDVLIKQLEKACSSCSSCGGSGSSNTANPTSPMSDERLVGGPGGIGELRTPGKDKHKLDDLSPRQREQILPSSSSRSFADLSK
jgi:hypothetical protein